MKYISIILVMMIFHSPHSQATQPVQNLFLDKPEDQALVEKLNSEITKTSHLIGTCIEQKKTSTECLCQNKSAVLQVNNQLKSTLEKHPDWKDKTLNLKSKDGQSVILDIPGLIQQSQIDPCGHSK